jgi:hypothetical protein
MFDFAESVAMLEKSICLLRFEREARNDGGDEEE